MFPNDDAALRLDVANLADQHGEWQTSDCRKLIMTQAVIINLEQLVTLNFKTTQHHAIVEGVTRTHHSTGRTLGNPD